MLHSIEIAGAGLFAFLGASLIIGGLARWTRATSPAHRPSRRGAAVFLFEGQQLVDATPAARQLLRSRRRRGSDLAEIVTLMTQDFGADLGPRLAALPTTGRLLLASVSGAGTLEAAEEGGALRLTLRSDEDGGTAIDRLSLDAARAELDLLRGLAEAAPQPIWTLDAVGVLTWANRAYLELADRANASPETSAAVQAAWPAESLFGEFPVPAEGQLHEQRCPLALPGWEEPLWFDVTIVRRGAESLHFATDVTALVQAESARLHSVQTLAKTFAHLSTGLAIFDRERRLVVFNPAFPDLTGLPIDFLIGRPLVHAVLDRLRDARILPEPRDYAAWRESVAALEAAAAQGDYRETWALPGGRTWRVTGRPHPDGALAFLFEDISDEVGLTRGLRAELDTMRSAIDSLDEAMALFSADGALVLSNAAYAELWGIPGETGLTGEIARWEAACTPSLLWTRLREQTDEALAVPGRRLRRLDGRVLGIRVSALPQGATLVAFRAEPKGFPLPDRRRDRIAPDLAALATTAEIA